MADLITSEIYKKPFKLIQKEQTDEYRKAAVRAGMIEISPEELNKMILEIGYKLSSFSHNHYSKGLSTGMWYLGKSVSFQTIKGNISFAHFEQSLSNGENLKSLQEIRFNYLVWDGKRIWDL